MMVLRLIPIFVALLFMLLQSVQIRLKMRDVLTVKINFNILAITLREDKTKKTRLKYLFNFINKLSWFSRSVKYFISKSRVSIIIFNKNDENSSASILNRIASLATEQFIISYLDVNSKSFFIELGEDLPRENCKHKTFFDATFDLLFIHLINSALILLYYITKNKIKEAIKNV